MKTSFTYIADTVIEIVVDGDSIEVTVLPPESSNAAASQTVNVLAAENTSEPIFTPDPIFTDDVNMGETVNMSGSSSGETGDAADPIFTPGLFSARSENGATVNMAPPKKQRGLRAFIRGAWTFGIAMFVEGGTYLLGNLTAIHIPPGVGLAGGALLQGAIYGAKKYVAPDSLL